MPIIEGIVKLIEDLKEKVKDIKDEKLREWEIEQLNVIKQLENLLTYPFVKEKFERREINIYGWYYIIETGDVYNYNYETKEFELII